MSQISTKQKILIEGMHLLQQRGLNGFSFQDIASKLKLSKPSLYDHYASKDELVLAIIDEYRRQFDQWAISVRDATPLAQIQGTFAIFEKFAFEGRKICPVLALGTDMESISPKIRKVMNTFVNYWLAWLEGRLKQGQSDGSINKNLPPKATAALIYSQLMGAQFQTRIRDDLTHIKEAKKFLALLLQK